MLIGGIKKVKFKYFLEFGMNFSLKYYYYRFMKKYDKKHKMINKYLYDRYIDKLNNNNLSVENIVDKKDDNKYIWVCWWQGENNMPPIVALCYKNLKMRVKTTKVILITKDNFKKYVEFPEYIYEKLNNGIISITHFSDILRAQLLYRYGGLWIDATIYISKDICEEDIMFNKKFFSAKREKGNIACIACNRWTAFLLGTNEKNSKLFGYMYYIFLDYWKTHNYLLDYLLIDYVINFLYENDNKIKNMIDDMSLNNIAIDELRNYLNDDYNEEIFNRITKNTIFHKLSWKQKINYEKKGTFYEKIKIDI